MLPNRANNFNCLRVVLALLVLLAHSPELTDGNRHRELLTRIFHNTETTGSLAVSGFFIVSGYLILKSWLSRPAMIPYLKKRVRRIFPAFIVASLICAFIVGPLGAASVSVYFADFQVADFLWGMVRLRQPVIPDVFPGRPYPFVNGSMWTIPIEFGCYLGIMAVGILGGIRKSAAIALLAIFLSLCMIDRSGHEVGWVMRFSLNLAVYFCTGSCFYIFRDRIHYTPRYALIAGVVLVIGMFSYRGIVLILPVAFAYLLFFFAFAKIECLAGFEKLPDVSYGVYLYGWPSQKLIIWWCPTSSPWIVFIVSAAMALAAGWASWHLVEKRFIHSWARRDMLRPELAVQKNTGS